MSLVQSEDRSAKLDRVVRKIVTHCGARVDGLPASEHAARADLASRMLAAAGGDEDALDLSAPAFVGELLTLSQNKTLT